jgi:hypothetical protein
MGEKVMDKRYSKAGISILARSCIGVLKNYTMKPLEQFSRKNAVSIVLSCAVTVAFCMPDLVYAGTYYPEDIALTPGQNMSQMNINWYSNSVTSSMIQVALKADMQGSEFPEASSASYYCTTASAASGYYANKATVADLSASTEYVYRLGDGSGNWTENYSFTTRDDDHFSFLAVGDPQIGASNISSDTAGWDDTLTEALDDFPDVAFILSAGDQVNTNNNESQFEGFFSPSEFRSLPVAPALGNHDTGAWNTNYHFNMPNLSSYGSTSPGSSDYYFTHGNALIMVINSNNTSGTTHETFIENTVAAHPDQSWRIVMFHHDIYGSGSHALEQSVMNFRAAMFPVFDENDIDIVFTGHDHSYTRTHVMYGDVAQLDQEYDENGAVIDPNGIVYFTLNSASGSKYYSLNAQQGSYVAKRSQVNVPTFSHITINGNTLSISTYRTDTMTSIDDYSIVKTGSGSDNAAPVFTVDPINKDNAEEDAAYSGSIGGTASDADSDPLTYSKVSGPTWLSIATDGSLSGTPSSSDVGANNWSVQVDDGNGGTDTATLNITVTDSSGWTQVSYNDFESGLGNWVDGGSDCALYSGGTFAPQGSKAVNLQDNTSTSVVSTPNLALSGYSGIKVAFSYYPYSMDNSNEDFLLQISTDGGSHYTTVEEWSLNDEFVNGNVYSDTVTITGYTLTNNTRIRFRCDAGDNNDDVYLDEIEVSAQ